jgi:hypothetical protein
VPVELVNVATSALSAPDGGVLTAGGDPPQLVNTPPAITLANGAAQSLDLDFTDPTASRPAFFLTLRPRSSVVRCATPCCWGCRATRRRRDGLLTGSVHYTVSTAADPSATTPYDLVIYPVSSTRPDVDPVDAVVSRTGQDTLLTGNPVTVPVTVAGPPGGSKGGGTSGTSGTTSGGTSGTGGCGLPASCSSDSDCAGVGNRHCNPKNGARCGSDHLCHCCLAVCGSGTGTCTCTSCSSSCSGDRSCIGTTCAFKVGARPCD